MMLSADSALRPLAATSRLCRYISVACLPSRWVEFTLEYSAAWMSRMRSITTRGLWAVEALSR